MNLISIQQAAKQGIERIRRPSWADPMDHLKIDIINDRPGPWLHLYGPSNNEINRRDPVDMLGLYYDLNLEEFVPYTGPLPDSEEYKSAQMEYARRFNENNHNHGPST